MKAFKAFLHWLLQLLSASTPSIAPADCCPHVSLRDLQRDFASSTLPCTLSCPILTLAHIPTQLLTRPCHSIINQAFDSRLRLDRRRPMNGDGFGVGGWLSSKGIGILSLSDAHRLVWFGLRRRTRQSTLHIHFRDAGSSWKNIPFLLFTLKRINRLGITSTLRVSRRKLNRLWCCTLFPPSVLAHCLQSVKWSCSSHYSRFIVSWQLPSVCSWEIDGQNLNALPQNWMNLNML